MTGFELIAISHLDEVLASVKHVFHDVSRADKKRNLNTRSNLASSEPWSALCHLHRFSPIFRTLSPVVLKMKPVDMVSRILSFSVTFAFMFLVFCFCYYSCGALCNPRNLRYESCYFSLLYRE